MARPKGGWGDFVGQTVFNQTAAKLNSVQDGVDYFPFRIAPGNSSFFEENVTQSGRIEEYSATLQWGISLNQTDHGLLLTAGATYILPTSISWFVGDRVSVIVRLQLNTTWPGIDFTRADMVADFSNCMDGTPLQVFTSSTVTSVTYCIIMVGIGRAYKVVGKVFDIQLNWRVSLDQLPPAASMGFTSPTFTVFSTENLSLDVTPDAVEMDPVYCLRDLMDGRLLTASSSLLEEALSDNTL